MFFIVRCSQIYEQYLKLQILYNNLADLICLNLGNETLDCIEAINLYDATITLQITAHNLLRRGWLE